MSVPLRFDVDGITQDYLTLVFQRDLSATEVDVVPELSFDLESWYDHEFWAPLVSEVDNGDGTASVTYRAVLPRSIVPQLYMRLSVRLRDE